MENTKILVIKKGFSIQSGKQEDENFFGREDEIKVLHECFKNGIHCLLKADRQHGKTALANKALERYKEKHISLNIDLNLMGSFNGLRNKMIREFIESSIGKNKYFKTFATMTDTIKDLVSLRLGSKVKIGTLEIELQDERNNTVKEGIESFIRSINVIDVISIAQSKKTIIFFDEVQKLIKLSGDSYSYFAEQFRAIIQQTENIVFFIAGSELSIIQKMVTKGNSRFLSEFKNIDLRGIKKECFGSHLQEACRERNIHIKDDCVNIIVPITGGIASNLSYMGNKIIDIKSSTVTMPIEQSKVMKIIFDCITYNETEYKEKKILLNKIDDGKGAKAYFLILFGEYENCSNIEDYDQSIEELLALSFIFINLKGSYTVEDPLFSVYYKTANKVKRKRNLKKILDSSTKEGVLLLFNSPNKV